MRQIELDLRNLWTYEFNGHEDKYEIVKYENAFYIPYSFLCIYNYETKTISIMDDSVYNCYDSYEEAVIALKKYLHEKLNDNLDENNIIQQYLNNIN